MPSERGSRSVLWKVASAFLVAVAFAASGCGDDEPGEPNGPSGEAGSGGAGEGGQRSTEPQKLVIVHTNDLHSHLMGHSPEADYTPASTGDDETRGGFARLAAAIGAARTRAADEGAELLLLDAGDFMMGTLFELVAVSKAPELSMMQALGYDATTIGNHELDWTPAGLGAILNAARAQEVEVPILASNMVFDETDSGDDALEALMEAGVLRTKLVKNVGSLRVGIFGVIGLDAVRVTPQAAPLEFRSIQTAAAALVAELREEDGVDLVIALSHSGVASDGTGEDAVLAQNVPGIDVIVSGHTHVALPEPVQVGNTLIVSAGSYGEYLGELAITATPAAEAGEPATVEFDGYTLLDVDDSIQGDAETQSAVDAFIDDVDALLSESGLSYRQVVATTETDLPLPRYAEAPVGNLVADAYRALGAALEPDDPPVIGVDANGQLRAPLLQGATGEVWFSDLFRVLPIGIGPDTWPGFPLVTFYLNAADIRAGLELGAGGEVISNDYFLQVSGLKVEYDPELPLFNRVTSLRLVTEEGEEELDLEDTETCYKIVTTSYVAGLLGVVQTFTSGLLAVNAKDADCETLVDPITRLIDADPEEDDVQELKQWQALLRYVSSFPDTDDDEVPNIPPEYGSPQDRIVER